MQLSNFSALAKFYRVEKRNVYDIFGTSGEGSSRRSKVGRHRNCSTVKRAFYAESNKLKISEIEAVFYYENLHF